MRIGHGYDIHRFADGRDLILAGVTFDEGPGLEGHSDADVVLHAVADAILGAAALGDIGDHFPPEDERWRDADSADLLRQVNELIRHDYVIANVDVTVVGERPKIKPRRQEMRESIAQILELDVGQVSVKATTNERLGALGRSEGLVSLATVLLEERE